MCRTGRLKSRVRVLARIDIWMKLGIIITTIGPVTMAHPPTAAPARRRGERGEGIPFACDHHLSQRFHFHWQASRAAYFKGHVMGHQVEDLPKKRVIHGNCFIFKNMKDEKIL